VIIPALNEAATIGAIVRTLKSVTHSVVVAIDSQTIDNTEEIAAVAGAFTKRSSKHGKGQLISEQLGMRPEIFGSHVMLVDADYDFTVRNPAAIFHELIGYTFKNNFGPYDQAIGIPSFPTYSEWKALGHPEIPYSNMCEAWGPLSGCRIAPVASMVGLHGYLTEAQINKWIREHNGHTHNMWMPGIHAPLRFTKTRLRDMEEHRKIGKEWGIINDTQGSDQVRQVTEPDRQEPTTNL
jgi:hypothetical protein